MNNAQAKEFNSDKSLTFLVYGLMLSVGAQRDHRSYSLPSTRLSEMWRGKPGLNGEKNKTNKKTQLE